MIEIDPDPFHKFTRWYEEARRRVAMADAVTLATATPNGRPSARMVLLRGHDEKGFLFFTNYTSRKARELTDNPHAALVLFWRDLGRQIRIEGTVTRATPAESAAYWKTRPRESRLAAHASRQSQPLEDPGHLEELFQKASKAHSGQEVPLPEFWGGFRVHPEQIEFWKNGEHRLHDRLVYSRTKDDRWAVERLCP